MCILLCAEGETRRLHRQVLFNLISLRSFDNEKPFSSLPLLKQFRSSRQTLRNTKRQNKSVFLYSSAEGETRTRDPILFRDMLYQLSYLGILFFQPLAPYQLRLCTSGRHIFDMYLKTYF